MGETPINQGRFFALYQTGRIHSWERDVQRKQETIIWKTNGIAHGARTITGG